MPEKETVTDFSQGVPLKTVQQVLRYWQTDYDWRKVEARLNAVPNFITEIDGLDIHFIHVRSKHENALPLIVTHGWPGSIVEQLKIIEPLTNPTAHGGSASDAFHLVIPSMPGYGFSGKPTTTGWGPERIARAWTTLMRRLGYKHFVAQGGDWGAVVTDMMGVQAPPELLGIHTNMPGAIPAEINQASFAGAPAPSGLSAEERSSYEQLVFFYKHVYYAFWMATRPQTLTGFADSPIGLATFLLDHDARSLELIARSFDGQTEGLTRDDVLDNVTLFWLTNTGVSSARLYWENKLAFFSSQGRQSPGCRERLPGRTLPDAAELGGAGLSQSHPLQQGRKGRSFRCLGTAEAFYRRGSRGLQVAAQIIEAGRAPGDGTAWQSSPSRGPPLVFTNCSISSSGGQTHVRARTPRSPPFFFGMAAFSLAAAWIGTRDSVIQLVTVEPFRLSGASDLASLGRATAWLNSAPLTTLP